jgi:putative glutamine amidotransferase
MSLPVILLTGCGEEALPPAYARAVAAAGGVPLLLPSLDAPAVAAAALAAADGLLLPGGGDLTPRLYGRRPHPKNGRPDLLRDRSELAAAREAVRRGLPILGICRGLQLINVAFGGTLHQHLPDLGLRPRIAHRGKTVRHRIRLAPGSSLSRLFHSREFLVNSTHHQAVDSLGAGLTATAWADDGVVEALEDPRRRILAVQSHPERLFQDQPEFLAIFRWLTAQAGRAQNLRQTAGS